MLTIEALEYRFPGGVQALAGIDLELLGGELCALVGANGSGKSTLLRLAALTLVPQAGRVRVFGRRWRARWKVAARMAWIPQDAGLDPTMTGAEHVQIQAALMGLSRRMVAARMSELVEPLRLGDALGRRVSSYSGGMRQRLHLLLGLIHEPELLLLDEPTAGLDPEGQAEVWAMLASLAQRGRGLLVASHDLVEIRGRATRMMVLEAGAVVGAGPPAELAEAQDGGLLGAFVRLTGREIRALGDGDGRAGGRGRHDPRRRPHA
ncbi:MAG: ABC transporter ATP-binding protein [Myxococcota bacterium]